MTVAEKILQIVKNQVGEDAPEVKPESRLLEDLGLDSLDSFEIAFEIECEFEIVIDDASAENVKTVADLVALVVATIASQGCLT